MGAEQEISSSMQRGTELEASARERIQEQQAS